MTVKRAVNESPDQKISVPDSGYLNPKEFLKMDADKFSGKKVTDGEADRRRSKVYTEAETDQESMTSSEEMESPRSVGKVGQWTPKKLAYVHSQILRIREEDSHLGDDIGEGSKEKNYGHHVASHLDVVLFSRPILPASPLGGKTAFKAVH